jgi:hypothetical protein
MSWHAMKQVCAMHHHKDNLYIVIILPGGTNRLHSKLSSVECTDLLQDRILSCQISQNTPAH